MSDTDATQDDDLVEQTDNGPDPDLPAPSQDPAWDPNAQGYEGPEL